MKKKITDLIDDSIGYKITNQPLEKVIAYLHELKEEYPLHDMYLEATYYNEYVTMSVYGYRDETDTEYETRLEKEKSKKEKYEENAKKSRHTQYLALKKEFEGESK
jgi:hypothetical protein